MINLIPSDYNITTRSKKCRAVKRELEETIGIDKESEDTNDKDNTAYECYSLRSKDNHGQAKGDNIIDDLNWNSQKKRKIQHYATMDVFDKKLP